MDKAQRMMEMLSGREEPNDRDVVEELLEPQKLREVPPLTNNRVGNNGEKNSGV